MNRLRYNGLYATLSGSHSNSTTTLTFAAALTYGNGTAVPNIAAPNVLPLTILDASGHLSEIVLVTAYTSGATSATVTRGQEGTAGVSHNSGDRVVHAPTTTDAALYPKLSPFLLMGA